MSSTGNDDDFDTPSEIRPSEIRRDARTSRIKRSLLTAAGLFVTFAAGAWLSTALIGEAEPPSTLLVVEPVMTAPSSASSAPLAAFAAPPDMDSAPPPPPPPPELTATLPETVLLPGPTASPVPPEAVIPLPEPAGGAEATGNADSDKPEVEPPGIIAASLGDSDGTGVVSGAAEAKEASVPEDAPTSPVPEASAIDIDGSAKAEDAGPAVGDRASTPILEDAPLDSAAKPADKAAGVGERETAALPQPSVSAPSAKPEALPAAKAGPPPKARYTVQIGSYTIPANAQRMMRQLSRQGFDPYSVNWEDAQGRKWRAVRVGLLPTRREAESLRREVRAKVNQPGEIIRIPKGG